MASGGFREAARAWSRTAGSVQSPPSRNRARSWEGFKSPTIGASTYSKWGYHDLRRMRMMLSARHPRHPGTFFTLPNGSCENEQAMGCRVSTNPFNRTDQRHLFDEVNPVADVDQSKSVVCVRADMDLRAGREGFVRSGCLQWFSEKDRIIPNLVGCVLSSSTHSWDHDLRVVHRRQLASSRPETHCSLHIQTLKRLKPEWFRQDLIALLDLLQQRKIKPLIGGEFHLPRQGARRSCSVREA